MDVAHGLQPIHARHEDIKAQQIEVAVFELGQSLAAVAGDVDTMAGALQQKPNCQLNGWIIINYQNFGHENLSTGTESGPTASCKGLLNLQATASDSEAALCLFRLEPGTFSVDVTEFNQKFRLCGTCVSILP
jgi:hypothetical protein